MLRVGLVAWMILALMLWVLPSLGVWLDAEENQTLENAQAALIVLSCLLPLWQLRGTSSLVIKHMLLTTALMPFSFFFREVEVKDMDLPAAMVFISSGLPNQILVVSLWKVKGNIPSYTASNPLIDPLRT